jgi:hypothetical protein
MSRSKPLSFASLFPGEERERVHKFAAAWRERMAEQIVKVRPVALYAAGSGARHLAVSVRANPLAGV